MYADLKPDPMLQEMLLTAERTWRERMAIIPTSDFDFGFSFSDGTDIPEVLQSSDSLQQSVITLDETMAAHDKLQARYDALLKNVNLFLNNLRQDSTKKYLLWPDRGIKVKIFQDKLNAI